MQKDNDLSSYYFNNFRLVAIFLSHFIGTGFHDKQRAEKEGKSKKDGQGRGTKSDKGGQHLPECGTGDQKNYGKHVDQKGGL